jgi:hypothetical protein
MIIVPLFNGESIFGLDVIMQTIDSARERQYNAFLGVNGVECLDFGSRMRTTQAAGRLIGDSPEEVGIYETRFRNYRNANAYTLLTTDGILWNNVILETFAPVGRIMGDFGTRQFWRSYQAKFIHLI